MIISGHFSFAAVLPRFPATTSCAPLGACALSPAPAQQRFLAHFSLTLDFDMPMLARRIARRRIGLHALKMLHERMPLLLMLHAFSAPQQAAEAIIASKSPLFLFAGRQLAAPPHFRHEPRRQHNDAAAPASAPRQLARAARLIRAAARASVYMIATKRDERELDAISRRAHEEPGCLRPIDAASRFSPMPASPPKFQTRTSTIYATPNALSQERYTRIAPLMLSAHFEFHTFCQLHAYL